MSHPISRARRLFAKIHVLVCVSILASCAQPSASIPSAGQPTVVPVTALAPTARPVVRPTATRLPTPLPSAVPMPPPTDATTLDPANDPVLVGAGDIAKCGSEGAAATAQLLDQIAGTVFTLGDNAYESGSAEQFRDCYDPTWGRHKARTHPTPGNHDYVTGGAAAYYDYFGERAGPAGRGYYSYDLGAWHIVALNSEIAASAESSQAKWLIADLTAHPAACTLAYWHKPIFSSGSVHGDDPHMRPIWDILAHAGADVVLSGHDHIYERFAPQTAAGDADPHGMREFVVGTGGASHYGIGDIQPNSEVRGAGVYGVLKLKLHATSYEWEFVPAAGGAFHDSGSAACVDSAAGQ